MRRMKIGGSVDEYEKETGHGDYLICAIMTDTRREKIKGDENARKARMRKEGDRHPLQM